MSAASALGLCYAVFSSILYDMAHTEDGDIFMVNGVRLLISEGDQPRISGCPEDEGSLSWHPQEPSGPHKCAMVHRLGNSASMHKSAVNCFQHYLKHQLEKNLSSSICCGFIVRILRLGLDITVYL